uniref:Nucleic acid-binding, OB-fold protein n=1 Tax=Tanacetum cinerariifolium TaxID=118510 RepID=A0A699KXC4_TANCI|nr:nucleic acid-binding, OB-fold protein [Tanacetum cinerariifolium]
MFSVRSLGANTDDSINNGIGPYVFKDMDEHNALVQLFRTARDKCNNTDIPEFKVKLYNVVRTRQHKLPTAYTLGASIFENGPETKTDYDVIIDQQFGPP